AAGESSGAMHTQAQSLAQRDVVTPKVVDRAIQHDAERRGRAGETCGDAGTASPAPVAAINELGDLSELPLGEIDSQGEWSIPKLWRTLKASLYPQQPRIAEREIGTSRPG